MKTTFDLIKYQHPKTIGIILAFYLIAACTDTEVQPLGQFTVIPDIATGYIGEYTMTLDNCYQENYSIEISRHYDDEVLSQTDKPKIVMTNLVNTGYYQLIAEWDGSAFIFQKQEVYMNEAPFQFSGRMYKDNDELSISYVLEQRKKSQSCSAKFIKQ